MQRLFAHKWQVEWAAPSPVFPPSFVALLALAPSSLLARGVIDVLFRKLAAPAFSSFFFFPLPASRFPLPLLSYPVPDKLSVHPPKGVLNISRLTAPPPSGRIFFFVSFLRS